MKNVRHMASTRPGYVPDDRAMHLDGKKDSFLVCTIPRAGQAMEIELHVQARRIQRIFKRYLFNIKQWAANVIITNYRLHRSRDILRRLQEEKQKHNKIIRQMKLRRTSTRLLGWRKETVLQQNIKAVGKRFFHSSAMSQLRWCLDMWQDLYFDVCEKNETTIFFFRKYRTHKYKCKAMFTWQAWANIQRELRIFVKKRLYTRWKRHVKDIVVGRTFGIETGAATAIQRAYRRMRARDYEAMEEMLFEGDVVAFKARRRRVAIRVQCRARILFSHKSVDARRCTRYALQLILLSAERSCDTRNAHRNLLRHRRDEKIRMTDENHFIQAHVREAYEHMPKLFGRFPTRCWIRTKKGKEAWKVFVTFLENKKKSRTFTMAQHEEDPRSMFKKVRLQMTQDHARKVFRERWPPEFCCADCGLVLTSFDGSFHVC
jgi:hypothetical protein